MYKSHVVIDTHGHISTPPQFRAYAYNLIVLRNAKEPLVIPDEAMKPASSSRRCRSSAGFMASSAITSGSFALRSTIRL